MLQTNLSAYVLLFRSVSNVHRVAGLIYLQYLNLFFCTCWCCWTVGRWISSIHRIVNNKTGFQISQKCIHLFVEFHFQISQIRNLSVFKVHKWTINDVHYRTDGMHIVSQAPQRWFRLEFSYWEKAKLFGGVIRDVQCTNTMPRIHWRWFLLARTEQCYTQINALFAAKDKKVAWFLLTLAFALKRETMKHGFQIDSMSLQSICITLV